MDLDSVESVRPICRKIFGYVQEDRSCYFSLDLTKLEEVAALVKKVSSERYSSGKVPYHSRLRHFPPDLLSPILSPDPSIQGSRLFDLVTVSVLLDAGAGSEWKFRAPKRLDSATGSSGDSEYTNYTRSEGLGAASLVMFLNGNFSSDPSDNFRVDAEKLKKLSINELSDGLQVTPSNPMLGLEGRWQLLRSLGSRLEELGLTRPSDLLKLLSSHQKVEDNSTFSIRQIWDVLFPALSPLWPKKDVWYHSTLGPVCFHKLFQWLLYSYVEVLELHYGWTVLDKELQTGLPEYRNGGLFVDLGVLNLRQPQTDPWPVSSDAVIEWRACTVVLLDLLKDGWFPEMPLCCMLEGGTWVAGRRAASQKRPNGDSPILLILDGTVF